MEYNILLSKTIQDQVVQLVEFKEKLDNLIVRQSYQIFITENDKEILATYPIYEYMAAKIRFDNFVKNMKKRNQ